MKLLIVDDEELTRNGLSCALDWNSLGIDEIFLADDGFNGLSIALREEPDIVLCDVRMPRMDGIAMLERIEAHQPDIAAIFMSGYSDKEYLKAAIKLKAISYIEKPIEPKEIESAILHAIEQREQAIRRRDAESVTTNMIAGQLAFQLTVPYASCRDAVNELCEKFHEYDNTDKFRYTATFIVRLEYVPEDPDTLSNLYQMLQEFLTPMHLHVIYTEKRMYHLVYHVFGSIEPSGNTLSLIAEKLGVLFTPFGSYYIAIGDVVSGISNVCHSYESAVILLQSSFFFEPGTILTSRELSLSSVLNPDTFQDTITRCALAVSELSYTDIHSSLARLNDICAHSTGLMPNQLKSAYYDLFSAIHRIRREQKLLPDDYKNIMDIMDSCFSFFTLHALLTEHIDALFQDMEQQEPENATIYLIRDYISTHYQENSLSVKDISSHVHLSASYVCTFFKNETGNTLNQYITEFRMEKAKQLLSDPRYRIADISSEVGYSDGNYFGKSFKKYTGFSPSEYREKVLR